MNLSTVPGRVEQDIRCELHASVRQLIGVVWYVKTCHSARALMIEDGKREIIYAL